MTQFIRNGAFVLTLLGGTALIASPGFAADDGVDVDVRD